MIVALLIVHGLLAVALLGAITHQAWSVVPRRAAAGPISFVGRFRTVESSAYATAVVVLFVVTAITRRFGVALPGKWFVIRFWSLPVGAFAML